MGYEADDVVAQGRLTATETVIARATATAYGADVRVTSGAIGLDAPFPYRFAGRADGVDLRRLPPDVPDSTRREHLVLGYDVHGQFSDGFIIGQADFEASQFLVPRSAPAPAAPSTPHHHLSDIPARATSVTSA